MTNLKSNSQSIKYFHLFNLKNVFQKPLDPYYLGFIDIKNCALGFKIYDKQGTYIPDHFFI